MKALQVIKPRFTPITVQITLETKFEYDMVHDVVNAMASFDSEFGTLTALQFDFVWAVMLSLRNGMINETEFTVDTQRGVK